MIPYDFQACAIPFTKFSPGAHTLQDNVYYKWKEEGKKKNNNKIYVAKHYIRPFRPAVKDRALLWGQTARNRTVWTN